MKHSTVRTLLADLFMNGQTAPVLYFVFIAVCVKKCVVMVEPAYCSGCILQLFVSVEIDVFHRFLQCV